MSTPGIVLGPRRLVTFTTDRDGVSPDHCTLMDERCPQLSMLTSRGVQFHDSTFAVDFSNRNWPRHGPNSAVIRLANIPWTILEPVDIRDEDQGLLSTGTDPRYTDAVKFLYAVTRGGEPHELQPEQSLLYSVRSYSLDPDNIACIVVITVVRGPEAYKREVRVQALVTNNGVIQAWRAAGQSQAAADFGEA